MRAGAERMWVVLVVFVIIAACELVETLEDRFQP
jgi:hypothetical protein